MISLGSALSAAARRHESPPCAPGAGIDERGVVSVTEAGCYADRARRRQPPRSSPVMRDRGRCSASIRTVAGSPDRSLERATASTDPSPRSVAGPPPTARARTSSAVMPSTGERQRSTSRIPLDGRHPPLYDRALASLRWALTPHGRLFIDGGDPLREIDLDRQWAGSTREVRRTSPGDRGAHLRCRRDGGEPGGRVRTEPRTVRRVSGWCSRRRRG